MLTGLVSVPFAMPVPWILEAKFAIFMMWVFLVLATFNIPILTGVLLTTMRPEDRPIGNSIANLVYNLLGFFPAPMLYGYVCSITGGSKSRWGMTLLTSMTITCFFFMNMAYISMKFKTSDDYSLEGIKQTKGENESLPKPAHKV